MHKKKVFYSILCICLVSAFSAFVCIALTRICNDVDSQNLAITVPQIIIDAGHGGEDGGAVNSDGVLEKDINLDISCDLRDYLKFFGYNVTMTRDTDTSLSTDEATIRARKVSDIKKRLEIFNSEKENIVISIHQNKFTETKYHGTQVFYSTNNSKSSSLAESIRYSVTTYLQPDNTRECKKATSSIYLLKHAQVPAVIVECGFISNYDECQKLLSEEYQKQMAYSISMGFLSYKNANY